MSAPALGTSIDPPPLVDPYWSGATLVVAATDAAPGALTLSVEVTLRVVHGDDDVSTALGRFEVGVASPAEVAPTWPDLAAKGELLLAPATVVGDIRVLGDDGALVAVYAVPARLVFLDSTPELTYPLADLPALLAPLGDVVAVGRGEVLADVGPSAVTAALAAAEVAP